MAYQLSNGPIITTSGVGSTVTARVDQIKSALVSANWIVTSGSSGDWTLTSGTTPQGLGCRIRVYNPGGGAVSARINWRNPSGSIVSTTDSFIRANSDTFRIIANPYQFVIYRSGGPGGAGRDFVFGGVPYIPAPCASITECVFGGCNAGSDSSSTEHRSFYKSLTHDSVGSNSGLYFTLLNGTSYNSGASDTGIGTPRLIVPSSAVMAANGDWTNNSCRAFFGETVFLTFTPYLCFGRTGPSAVSTINGVLWDAFVSPNSYDEDTEVTLDTYTWRNVTFLSAGDSTNELQRGSLFMRTS